MVKIDVSDLPNHVGKMLIVLDRGGGGFCLRNGYIEIGDMVYIRTQKGIERIKNTMSFYTSFSEAFKEYHIYIHIYTYMETIFWREGWLGGRAIKNPQSY